MSLTIAFKYGILYVINGKKRQGTYLICAAFYSRNRRNAQGMSVYNLSVYSYYRFSATLT